MTNQERNTDTTPTEGNAERLSSRRSGNIAKKAGAASLLALAIAGSFIGGAIAAVGAPRLKQALFAPATNAEHKSGDDLPQYVSLPETAYELLGGDQHGYLLARFSIKTQQQEAVESRMPELRAVLQSYIRELSPADLKGAPGIYRLRRDCMLRMRKVVGEEAVQDVFITDLVIQ